MNEERQKIIGKLMHDPNLKFNELWNKQGTSNSFAYHLKVLEEDGLIKKKDEGYSLTHEGKKYATYLEGSTGEKSVAPLIGVIVVVVDGDKVLLSERTKEPFYGIWGLIGGKIKFDQYILECAKAELKEETGLECDIELKGLFSSKTYNNKSLSYNHQLFILKGTNPRGELLKETREGRNEWTNISEVSKRKTFPNVSKSIEIVHGDSFTWLEADRFQEDDDFKEMKILREKKF